MSEQPRPGQDEATEAAQNVADSVESWEYSAEEETVRDELDRGLEDAGVQVPQQEKDKLVDQIKAEDDDPEVERARPDEEA